MDSPTRDVLQFCSVVIILSPMAGHSCHRLATWLAVALASSFAPGAAGAESLADALTRASEHNPTINAQRANAYAVNENLPRTRAGYLPKIGATADVAREYERTKRGGSTSTSNRARSGTASADTGNGSERQNFDRNPKSYGVEVVQPVFDGFRTPYAQDQAERQYQGALQLLRNTEQTVLLEVVRAYAGVLTNRAIVANSRANVSALKKQLEHIRARRSFGDATKTDEVQIEARAAAAAAQVTLAEDELRAAIATYERVTGAAPDSLAPIRSIDQLLPPTLEAALQTAIEQNPSILAANHGVDAARLQVRIVEGEFLPTVNLTGAVKQSYDDSVFGDETLDATVRAQVRIPLYEGGEVRARARQAGHVSSQRQLEADAIRDQVHAAVKTTWSQLQNARARLQAASQQVSAAASAVAGIREEYRAGERTTYDLLTAEQDYLSAQIAGVSAKRDRVIATYVLAQAAGLLDFAALQEHLQNGSSAGAAILSEATAGSVDTKPARSEADDASGACTKCEKKIRARSGVKLIETRAEEPRPKKAKLVARKCDDCKKAKASINLRLGIVTDSASRPPPMGLRSTYASELDFRSSLRD